MKNLKINRDILDEEASVHNEYTPRNGEVITKFEVFFKNQYRIENAKYPFLSRKQIEQRVTDVWKKKYGSYSNKLKKAKPSTNRPEKFEHNSFHSWSSPSAKRSLVPLDVDFVPVIKSGAQNRSDKSSQKRQVSFNKELYIRYRTTSEESSNSTLKDRKGNNHNDYDSTPSLINSPQNFKSIMYHKSYISPKIGKPEMEKKFDKLLNEKCTWSYKAQRVRSNKITNEEDSTIHLKSTVMTIEISENTPDDKEFNNKALEKSMKNENWLRDEQAKTNGAKNYKRKSIRSTKNKVHSPSKSVYSNKKGKTFRKRTLENSKRKPSKKLSNSDRVLRKRSLKPKDKITVLSSSSDEEVLQARNPAHDKVIYKENEDDSNSYNMSDREIVSDQEEILESGSIMKKTSPIIIQATPYINQDHTVSSIQTTEGKQSSDKSLKSQPKKDNFFLQKSKKIEFVSDDSLSVEPNTPNSERENSKEITNTNNHDESNVNVENNDSFDNCSKKHSLKYLPENMADNDFMTQDLEKSETTPDKNIISDFLDGSFDVSTYEVKDRYFDYDPVENSEKPNSNKKVLEKNEQFENETTSPELFTDDFPEINIFKKKELNYSGRKHTRYKQNELVRNSSVESQMFPAQKRKIIKKRQTKNVNKKRKIQSLQVDSESEEKSQKKVKNTPKHTFIECINLDSTGDEGTIYRKTRNSSLLASRRIKEIGKVESISVINDSDIYSVHDEVLSTSLPDNIRKNFDEITKKYLKNNMHNGSIDVAEYNRETKKYDSVDKGKKGTSRSKKTLKKNKFKEDRNKNNKIKELASNLYLSDDQSLKNQKNETGFKTDNEEHNLREKTDETGKNEKLIISNISDDEENYSLRRWKCSARNKMKFHQRSKAANNEHLLRENKNNSINKEWGSDFNFCNDESARNQKYLTRSKNQTKFKVANDEYHFEKNNKDKKNTKLTSNINLSDEEVCNHNGFYKNLHLEREKRGRIEEKNKKLSKTENETKNNIEKLKKGILPKYTKDINCENITKGTRKTWDDLENELFKEFNNEMTLADTGNVSKTIIVREEKVVRKKNVSDDTNSLTVSNRSMTQRISKSLKSGSYMQYKVQNTQSEYLQSTTTDTNPMEKEIIPANSENMNVLQKAIAAMEKCTAEFMKQMEVNTVKNRWLENNLMIEEKSDSLSNDIELVNNVLLEENEPCTSTKMLPYRKNLRSFRKCINYKNKTPKVLNYHSLSKKDDIGNFDSEYSVNIAYKNSSVDSEGKSKQNIENQSLELLQEGNPWNELIKKLDLEQNYKNDSRKLYKETEIERKETHRIVLNSYNTKFNENPANTISEIDDTENKIDMNNKLTDLGSLNHNIPEVCTSLKEDTLNNDTNLLTNSEEKKKSDSNDRSSHDYTECGMRETAIEKAKSNRKNGRNLSTHSKGKSEGKIILLEGKNSPLKLKVTEDGSLKVKKHSSKSSSVTSSSGYSKQLKTPPKNKKIELYASNKTNKAREKYVNYLKELYKMDSVVEKDQTAASNVEAIEQFSQENEGLVANETKKEIQMPKLIAQKDDDVFSVSSSESDGSKKDISGTGLFCEMFDE